jgi:hypothetical protein
VHGRLGQSTVLTEQTDAISGFSAQLQTLRNEAHLFAHFSADSASFACNKVILFRKISKKARFSANSVRQFR